MEEKEGRLRRRSGLGFQALEPPAQEMVWAGDHVTLLTGDSRGRNQSSFGISSHWNYSTEFTLNGSGNWDSVYNHFHQNPWSLVSHGRPGLAFPWQGEGFANTVSRITAPRHTLRTW